MKTGSIILLCGLPGSGKTTLAKKLESKREAIRLCPDEWIISLLDDHRNLAERDRLKTPVEKILFETAQKLAQLGINVILENGFWVKSERDFYKEMAKKAGTAVELYYLEAPLKKLWERVDMRNKILATNAFKISLKELTEWNKLFEPPTTEELKTYDNFGKYFY